MKKFVKKHLLTLIGVAVGALAGYFYWQQIGCNSGTCAITSSPVNSTLYGSVMGGLLFSMFKREKNRTDDISGNN
ncbi:DUF6132 family protein [Capnocytophaga canis]|uniref:YtxH domain-containing protein n=1 Tax=Capnocytophaga canis TaxID=1848903 RepID=A0A0B7I6C2_9FLAO|nr:DUF6132 family protein [Capnocytophaga canis]CEN47481.1 conserved exported hypothetical protein [Capnocytophaga canis]